MILYFTKQTIERFGIKMPEELSTASGNISKAIIEKEQGDRLLEWGCKLFYFDGAKCLQLVNFESKFTIVMADIKKADIVTVPDLMARYMLMLYKDDAKMSVALKKMFEENHKCSFAKLTDRSAISTLNRTQLTFLEDGYALEEYLKNNVLQTIELNKELNFQWLFTRKIDKKTEYFYSGELFRKLVIKRFGK